MSGEPCFDVRVRWRRPVHADVNSSSKLLYRGLHWKTLCSLILPLFFFVQKLPCNFEKVSTASSQLRSPNVFSLFRLFLYSMVWWLLVTVIQVSQIDHQWVKALASYQLAVGFPKRPSLERCQRSIWWRAGNCRDKEKKKDKKREEAMTSGSFLSSFQFVALVEPCRLRPLKSIRDISQTSREIARLASSLRRRKCQNSHRCDKAPRFQPSNQLHWRF